MNFTDEAQSHDFILLNVCELKTEVRAEDDQIWRRFVKEEWAGIALETCVRLLQDVIQQKNDTQLTVIIKGEIFTFVMLIHKFY